MIKKLKTVNYLLIVNNDPWASIIYMCGDCSQGIASSGLERHAVLAHKAEQIKLMNNFDGESTNGMV